MGRRKVWVRMTNEKEEGGGGDVVWEERRCG